MAKQTQEKKAKANGIEINYDMFGDEKAQPILLIQGLSMQMLAWHETFCSKLADKGFLVIRFDNRDVGLSTRMNGSAIPNIHDVLNTLIQGKTPDIPYTLNDMAADAFGLLDALGIDSANIVGISMGGFIAQVMAINHPERVGTLTLLMSSTGEKTLPPPLQKAAEVLLKPFPTDKQGYIEATVHARKTIGGSTVDEKYVRALATRLFDRGIYPQGVARQLAAVISAEGRKPALQKLSVPTLVIHGEADPLFLLECGKDIAATIPKAKLSVIPELGHDFPPVIWDKVIDDIVTLINT